MREIERERKESEINDNEDMSHLLHYTPNLIITKLKCSKVGTSYT